MLAKALRGEGELPDGVSKPVEELAELIEDELFKKFKDTGTKYKNQIRSRVFNLRDKKNPALRENVLCGVISPERFAFMKSEEMASDEVRSDKFNTHKCVFVKGLPYVQFTHKASDSELIHTGTYCSYC